ncbi:MAG: dynamin family protein [Peptococcaceae bacterium]|nr:dynamin family protein [Peptococcaceae bacterium]
MNSGYGYLKKEVVDQLEMVELSAQQRDSKHLAFYVKEIREKLGQDKFNLVVLGEFKRGKTTFLNSLLGADLLPTAVVPLTSIVTVIQYGENLKCEVVFQNGDIKEIPLSKVADYATEERNPGNEKKVKLVEVKYPSPFLKEGLLLIDTPGVGSIYRNNTDETHNYLPKVDAAIFLLSSDQPLSQTECEFLKQVKQYSAKTFFVLNKIDYLDEKDRPKALEFAKRVLEEQAGFDNVKIIPLSAKMALEGKLKNCPEILAESNLTEFTSLLEKFLLTEKGITALAAACSKGINAVNELLMGMELETKALMIPLEELGAKIDLFDKMVENLSLEQQDNKYIFRGEMEKVYHELEREITHFQETRNVLLEKEIDRLYQEKKNLSNMDILRFFKSFIESAVKEAFEEWRPKVEEKVKTSFEKVVVRFTDKTNRVISDLLRQSAEIFEVSVEGFTRMESITDESKLYYVFVGEQPLLFPDTLKMSAFFLPKFIAGPVILREMKKKIERDLDRNCGRIRTDYNDRIYKSARLFQKAFEEKFASVVEGTRTVLARSIEKRRISEKETNESLEKIKKQIEQLHNIKERLQLVYDSAKNTGITTGRSGMEGLLS